AFASLYTDDGWSKALDEAIASAQKELSKSSPSLVSIPQLQFYRSELHKRGAEGFPVTFVDFWGLFIEYLIFGQ
ncbi:cytosolic phospholipase A2 zeta-like, partial [Clarias magur]